MVKTLSVHCVAYAGFDDHLAVDPCDVVLDARLRRLHVGEVLLQLGTLLLHSVLQVSLHLGDGLLCIDDVTLLLVHLAVLGAQVILSRLQFVETSIDLVEFLGYGCCECCDLLR